jgi:uncharacterized protein YkwD
MRISSALLILGAVTFTACATTSQPQMDAGTPAPSPAVQTPQLSNGEITQQLFDAINQQRTANGLTPLTMSPELAVSAQQHSDKMVSGNFLSTQGADEASAITRITSQGVKTLKLGEDVVRIKTRTDRVADETVSTWMAAAPNRKNILSAAFTRVGIAVTRTDGGDFYVCADFAQ